jgi:hypothetical protein
MVVAYLNVLPRIYIDIQRKKKIPVRDFLNNGPLWKNEVHLTWPSAKQGYGGWDWSTANYYPYSHHGLDNEIHILADIHLIYTLHPENAQKCNNLNKFAGVTNRQPANKIINIKHQKALTYLWYFDQRVDHLDLLVSHDDMDTLPLAYIPLSPRTSKCVVYFSCSMDLS